MKQYFVFILFYSSSVLFAQDDLILPKESYREDQYYAAFSFLLADESIEDFRLNGFSYSINFGFIRDIPLNLKSNKAIGLGLGYGFNKYSSNLTITNKESTPYKFIINKTELSASVNTLVTRYIEIPIEYRWRTSTISTYAFWRVYVGYIIKYNFMSRLSPFDNSSSTIISEVNKFSHAFKISMGHNTWNIYLEYNISPYFKNQTQTDLGTPLKINVIKMGLIFYVL